MTPSTGCPACGSVEVAPYPTPFPDRIVRCRSCGARFVHPPPTAAELRSRYDAEHGAGKWRALFDAADPAEVERRARLLARLLEDRASAPRLLDVGCGDGSFLDAARGAGWDPTGVELSRAAVAGLAGRQRVVVGPLAAFGADGAFHAVTFWDVLEHLADPADAVRAAVRLLAPGGLLAASMPNASGAEALLRGRGWRYHDVAAYGHLVHLAPRHLRRMLRDAGLELAWVETRGSPDLRDLLGGWVGRTGVAPLVWLLDRASGALARVAVPGLRGNTILIVGRRPVR